jgi:Flp pilus assembly protein TadG
MTSLSADRQGSTYVEFLVVVIPFVLFVLCVFQTALLEFADLVVERSANAAARSAVVVLDDDPAQYQGEQRNSVTAGGARERAIRLGAANTLAALHEGDPQADSAQLEVRLASQPGSDQAASSFDPAGLVTVRVTYRFRCIVPLARRIMCRDGDAGSGGDTFALINGAASLPNQGARYAYAGGGQ